MTKDWFKFFRFVSMVFAALIMVTACENPADIPASPKPETPVITLQPTGGTYNLGDDVDSLTVTANVSDGGTLRYQWYSSPSQNGKGTAIDGATADSYTPPVSAPGTVYYYVVVTNTIEAGEGNLAAEIKSNVVSVRVIPLTSDQLQIHYLFNSGGDGLVEDESGNGYKLTLKDGASIKETSGYRFLDTGNSGWADMGAGAGSLTERLTNFTIAFYIYIPGDTAVSGDGNMIVTFSNSADLASDANGAMYMQAKSDRQGFTIGPQHWTGEQYVRGSNYFGADSGKSFWHHVAYTQAGKTGTGNGVLYVDGAQKASGTITMTPADLGNTAYNFFARPPYTADSYLKNTLIWDFRVYDIVLASDEISDLAGELDDLGTALYTPQINEYITVFETSSLPSLNLSGLTQNLSLPASGGDGISIVWASANTNYLADNGTVTRPGLGDQTFNLTATFSKGNAEVQKVYPVTVIRAYSDAEKVAADKAALALAGNIENLRSNLTLPAAGAEGSTIVWASNNQSYLTNAGLIVQRPAKGSGPLALTLTATITSGQVSETKEFTVYIAEDEGYGAYLFVYFTGNSMSQEQLRYALSTDGLKYTALNNNNPIIASSAISMSDGIRDPHILRGGDGKFYMVMTDMQSGLGWNSNRGIILLKSDDLITWTHSQVHFPARYAGTGFANVERVWAPQTIWDAAAGKYMIYFSLYGGTITTNTIYYAYANADFTDLEGQPQVLVNPNLSQQNSMIDGDIIFYKNKYHLFYKEETGMNDISKMVSSNLSSGYQPTNMIFNDDPNGSNRDVEGSCVFRLFNTDIWILMYDVYNQSRYEFRQSMDLDNFITVPSSEVSVSFGPRHGTVIPITVAEKAALEAKTW
jgi:hypothetical protein